MAPGTPQNNDRRARDPGAPVVSTVPALVRRTRSRDCASPRSRREAPGPVREPVPVVSHGKAFDFHVPGGIDTPQPAPRFAVP